MVVPFVRTGVVSICRSTCPVFVRNFSVASVHRSPVLSSNSSLFFFASRQKITKMSSGIERLQKNAKIAEDLIAEIQAKINSLASSGGNNNVESVKNSTDELRNEVAKWTEILTMVEIRKGLEPSFYLHYLSPEGEVVQGSTKTEVQTNNTDAPKSEPAAAAPPANQGKGKKNADKGSKPDENLNVPEKKSSSQDQPAEGGKKQKNKAPAKPKEAGGGGAVAPAAAAPEVVDISRLDLRIGKIVQVEKHPEADSLYLEKIDVGEANPRTVISGLVKHVPLEEMQNRMVVLLCNLKPAKMRGITSEAMVMCASTPDKVEVLSPPAGSVPGDLVEFEGYPRNPDAVLNPKKKIFETVAPDLKTNDAKVATYKGVPFTVPGKGQVVAQTLANVNIK